MKKRWLVPLLFVITAGVVGFGFTEEKAQKVQKMNYKYQTVRAVNPGSRAAALNPLRKDAYPELSQTVKEYYKKLGNDRDFIEAYDNIRVYTKVGKYTGSYVVFARYKMKVKDIYTKIPGLGTLYIEKDGTSGEYEKLRVVTYSNGVKVYFNYSDLEEQIDGVTVPAFSYVTK